jgi:hypothetical protein
MNPAVILTTWAIITFLIVLVACAILEGWIDRD